MGSPLGLPVSTPGSYQLGRPVVAMQSPSQLQRVPEGHAYALRVAGAPPHCSAPAGSRLDPANIVMTVKQGTTNLLRLFRIGPLSVMLGVSKPGRSRDEAMGEDVAVLLCTKPTSRRRLGATDGGSCRSAARWRPPTINSGCT